jgi:GGDEF domain-containing protein
MSPTDDNYYSTLSRNSPAHDHNLSGSAGRVIGQYWRSQISQHGPNFSSVLKAADTALYKVKAQGGDDFINYQVTGVTEPGGIISTLEC